MFAVDDVAEAVKNLQTRGVKFKKDGEVDETPVCFMAFGYDTEGNQFFLHKHK